MRCEACGEEFKCGATITRCWCSEIKVSSDIRHELRKRYKNCLCRSCLEAFSKTSPHAFL
ncbi:MAG: cysteine-rich CWC family protein [Blastocatellia bacterium]|nr:cysteine-rich CWC family protein [Blastocatellia bacterium]